MQLNKSNGVYSKMVADLYHSIASGELPVGTRLPTETELRDQFKISINSVRKGIALLINDGIIARQQGSGTYVIKIPSTPARRTRQDSIGVFYETKLATFHPYYSEVRRGIAEELERLGWNLLPLAPYDSAPEPWERKYDVIFHGYREMAIANLASHPEVAGAILFCHNQERFITESGRSIPLVVPGLHESLPSAGYDWMEETLTALRVLIRNGAKGILSVGGAASPTKGMHLLLRRAAAAENIRHIPAMKAFEAPSSSIVSTVIRAGYELARDGLSDMPDCDAVLAGSDFIAQGVLDALTEHRSSGGADIRAVALVNRASRIHTTLPFTSVVSDGHRVGAAAAELLHTKITAPASAPDRIVLRGEIHEIRGGAREAI